MEWCHNEKILAWLFIIHLMDKIKYIFNLFLFFSRRALESQVQKYMFDMTKLINKLINKIDCLQLTEMFSDSFSQICVHVIHIEYI